MTNPAAEYMYFADPARFSTWTNDARHCDLCAQAGPGYEGPFHGDGGTIGFLCEDCLTAGLVTEEGIVLHQADLELLREQVAAANPHLPAETVAAIVEDRFAELAEETPPIKGNPQGLLWPVHCCDFCRFIDMAPADGGGTTYRFECLECHEPCTVSLP